MADHHYPFAKLHSSGNSCIVVLDLEQRFEKWREVSPVMLHPHLGIGADQMLVVRESQHADFEVLGFDPDGSLVGMCGNGLRCTAAVLQHWKHVAHDSRVVELVLEGRRVRVSFSSAPSRDIWSGVQVNLGKPIFESEHIPVRAEKKDGRYTVVANGKEWNPRCLSVGNPHSVIFVDEFDLGQVAEIGALLERHEAFPEGTSVEFVYPIGPNELRIGIWERSTGLASACCSGTAAALVAAVEEGVCDGRDTLLHLPGGDFFGSYEQSSGEVSVSGEVVLLGDGILRPSVFERELGKASMRGKGNRRSEITTLNQISF